MRTDYFSRDPRSRQGRRTLLNLPRALCLAAAGNPAVHYRRGGRAAVEASCGRPHAHSRPMMAMPQAWGAPPMLWLRARLGAFFTWRSPALPCSCL